MISRLRIKGILAASVMLLAVALTGCRTPQDVAYFQDVAENTMSVVPSRPMKIESTNRLMIVVKSREASVNILFNKAVTQDGIGEGYTYYTVSREGTIDFPVLGVLKVEGMTTDELAGFIKGEIIGKGYAKEVVVTVTVVDRGYSVLGEVKNPGRYGFHSDEMNIMEAIAGAGDLSIQGKRENVKLIRMEGDTLKTYVMDLTNLSEMSKSPAFQIKQGDVIYVEPNNQKKRETTSNGNAVMNLSFWVSVASLLTTVLVLIKK
ncbi:MAG: polysaccharide biosynthesis/export family protein [Muribaculaceae bacterium]|nr:polysaccharide biosynthesis/export family protein [Muribaculaceae bacterium]